MLDKVPEDTEPLVKRIWLMYYDGFRTLSPLGKRLWLLIIIKLILFFAIMKLFFFPNLLQRDYDNDDDRAQAVRSSLVHPR